MKNYIKDPRTVIFTGQTRCGKTHLVLDLIENQYFKHFGYIFIICPTLDTHHAKIKNNDQVWLIEPKYNLYQWIQKLSELFIILSIYHR